MGMNIVRRYKQEVSFSSFLRKIRFLLQEMNRKGKFWELRWVHFRTGQPEHIKHGLFNENYVNI